MMARHHQTYGNEGVIPYIPLTYPTPPPTSPPRRRPPISTIALTELLYGAATSARPEHNRQEVERFAARLDALPFDAAAADHAADIRATLERRGQTIGGYDLLIAGHAHSTALPISAVRRVTLSEEVLAQTRAWRDAGIGPTAT